MFNAFKSNNDGSVHYIYFQRSQIGFTKYNVFLSLGNVFTLINSVDPGEYAAFHLGLQCLSKYIKGFTNNSSTVKKSPSGTVNFELSFLTLRKEPDISGFFRSDLLFLMKVRI